MKLKNIHLEEEFLTFVKREAKRRDIKEAEVIREITRLGEVRYKQRYKLKL